MRSVRKRKRDRERDVSQHVEPGQQAKNNENDAQPRPGRGQSTNSSPGPTFGQVRGRPCAHLEEELGYCYDDRVERELQPRVADPPPETLQGETAAAGLGYCRKTGSGWTGTKRRDTRSSFTMGDG